MNRTFRKVWSRARGTVVVASELAKRRGAGARATQTNRGVGIGLLALALAATGSVYAQAPAVAQKPDATSAESISRSEEHTSELQSLMRISYAVFCLKKKKK